ncbi:hypothetical protein [Prauserella cavernicola]|uniref:Uncharacterized protein n=1 Tax=Prauserella cavernicola TaxID=2800127 RepID=A0A934V2S6_9PSEU|nr:hypothetical protein [Prauserella cavernicola]MBK1783462.1 hypothetical protein [Prauserella cavernicola]
MSSYISINTSPNEIRSAGGQLVDLGGEFRDSGDWAEIAALEVFGDDKFGDTMRSNYPSTFPVFENKKELGGSLVEIGQNCQTAMDLYEGQENTNTENVDAVDHGTL